MAALPEILEWRTLTAAVNEFKNPAAFLKNLVFGNRRNLRTENITYRVQTKGRQVAPFVTRNGAAIMSGGYGEFEANFSAPNIRIKRPLEAVDLIFNRHAGDVVFVEDGDVEAAAEREVALQLQALDDEISNAEEYLCAQAIRGVISYTSADEAAFTVDFQKPAGNTITLSSFWDQASPTPLADILGAARVMHDEVTLNPSVCVLGSEATDAFLALQEIRDLLDIRRMNIGNIDLTRGIDELGAIPLGRIGTVDFWSYTRQVDVTQSGVTTSYDLIRPKYAEFLNVSPSAQHTLYYAAIPDLQALRGGLLSSARFSKSWEEEDPSVMQLLLASRPLPVMRRPGASVSMKVVSG